MTLPEHIRLRRALYWGRNDDAEGYHEEDEDNFDPRPGGLPGNSRAGEGGVPQQTAGELFEKALYVEEGQGDLQKAIELYQDIVKRFPENREVAAKAQLHIGLCYEKLGTKEA